MYNKQNQEYHNTEFHNGTTHNIKKSNIDLLQIPISNLDLCRSYQCTLSQSTAHNAFIKGYDTTISDDKSTKINLTIASSRSALIKGLSSETAMEGVFCETNTSAANKIMQEIRIRANEVVMIFEITRQTGYEQVNIDSLTLTDFAKEKVKNDPIAFYGQWGSHFLSRITKGNRFYIILSIKSELTENIDSIEADLKSKFDGDSYRSDLGNSIKATMNAHNARIRLKQTGGPAPDIDANNIDDLLQWIDTKWIPEVDAKPSILLGSFSGYWTLVDNGTELKTLTELDFERARSLIDAMLDYDDCYERLDFILFDHQNSRFPRMPVNFFGTTESEISTIKDYLKEIVLSRTEIIIELRSKNLDHETFNQLLHQNMAIAKPPQSYFKYLKGLNLADRYPIVPGEEIYLRADDDYIGITTSYTCPVKTSLDHADKFQFMHNNPFLLNNNTVFICSLTAGISKNGGILTVKTDQEISYEHKGLVDGQDWKISGATVCRNSYIRPRQKLRIWNTHRECELKPWPNKTGVNNQIKDWTIERC